MKWQTHWRLEPPGQMEHTMQTTVRPCDKYLEQSEQDFYYYYHLIGTSCLFAYNYAAAAAACNRLPAVICAFNDVFCVTVFRWLRSLCYTIARTHTLYTKCGQPGSQPAQQNCRTFQNGFFHGRMGDQSVAHAKPSLRMDELVPSVCCNQCIISYVVNFDLPALRKTAFHFPPCMHASHAAIRGAESIRRLQINIYSERSNTEVNKTLICSIETTGTTTRATTRIRFRLKVSNK